jgi:Flp pilus assembly protein TadB
VELKGATLQRLPKGLGDMSKQKAFFISAAAGIITYFILLSVVPEFTGWGAVCLLGGAVAYWLVYDRLRWRVK